MCADSAKETYQKPRAATDASRMFLYRMLIPFFARTAPTSSMEKPACMKNTIAPAVDMNRQAQSQFSESRAFRLIMRAF